MVGEEICGAVISIRFQEDIISVWNKTANDQATTARIRDTLKRVLNLPPNTIMEYKTHTDSLRRAPLSFSFVRRGAKVSNLGHKFRGTDPHHQAAVGRFGFLDGERDNSSFRNTDIFMR